MMIYKCLIVDDEELARDLIANHLSQLAEFEVVASCESAIEARSVLQKETIDLIFLDIEMPVLKGTDFFKNLVHKPNVIFTTAHRNYAIEGFDLNAVDYLLKPITFERFFKATEKFLNQQQSSTITVLPQETKQQENFIFIRKDRKQVKVFLDSILYIESVKDYVKIHVQDKTHMVKYSISSFFELLDSRFLRVHRSYIINVDKITAYTKHDMEIGNIEIPIGERYRQAVQAYFKS